jgi:hypothetical protein
MSPQLMTLLNSTQVSEFNNLLMSILKNICDRGDWEYGEVWLPEAKTNLLELSPVYYIRTETAEAQLTLEQFYNCSEEFILSAGEGLPGRVWHSGESEWLVDATIESETYFLRNQIAQAFGIRTGLGIPFKINGKIKAILVFFMRKCRVAERELIEEIQQTVSQMESIWSQRRK